MNTKLTQEQKSLFESISQGDKASMEMLETIWDSSASYEPKISFDKEAAFSKFMDNIDSEPIMETTLPESKGGLVSILWKSAVAIAVATALFFAYNSIFAYKTIKTTDNIEFALLDDGTEVWINKNSELKYPRSFASDARTVSLKGEAYFDVERNVDAPFEIELANDNVVTVLGTEFNINDRFDSKVEVSVTEGKVNLKNTENEELSVDLSVGQRGILNNAKGEIKSVVFEDNITAWKESEMRIQSGNIHDVLTDIGNFYGVQFKFDNAKASCDINSVTVNRDMSIEDAVKIINRPFADLRITKTTNTLYYVQGSCK